MSYYKNVCMICHTFITHLVYSKIFLVMPFVNPYKFWIRFFPICYRIRDIFHRHTNGSTCINNYNNGPKPLLYIFHIFYVSDVRFKSVLPHFLYNKLAIENRSGNTSRSLLLHTTTYKSFWCTNLLEIFDLISILILLT